MSSRMVRGSGSILSEKKGKKEKSSPKKKLPATRHAIPGKQGRDYGIYLIQRQAKPTVCVKRQMGGLALLNSKNCYAM